MKLKTFTFIFVFAIAGLVAGMIGCERAKQAIKPATQMEGLSEDISIGVVTSQTGVFGPTESDPGASIMENGFRLALEEINQSQLLGEATFKLVVEDDMSTIEGAIASFNKVIRQDKVSAIVGIWTSQIAQFVFPIAQENQVVVVSPVTSASGLAGIGEFIFCVNLTTDILIPNGVAVTQAKLGYTRVATITDEDDLFSQSSELMLKQTFDAKNIEVSAAETISSGDTDFSIQLTRIKGSDPDVVFISAQPIEAARIIIQGRQLGIPFDVPFIVGLNLSIDDIQRIGDAAEGVITFTSWSTTVDTPGNQSFVQNYKAKYGAEPSIWAALAYTDLHILTQAIANAQSIQPKAIATALADIRDFDTILGKFSFDSNGDAIYDPVVLIVKNGKLEVFE